MTAARALSLLRRPGAWIAACGDRYHLRLSPDRRRRATLSLDEAAFRALLASAPLVARPDGGWRLSAHASPGPDPQVADDPPGRPGFIPGERAVTAPDGRVVAVAANLGESPIAWLARRKDPSGRPWLSPAEAAAGERLRMDAEAAARGPSLTMRWDAAPRSAAGLGSAWEPGERARAAEDRVRAALSATSAEGRGMLRRICIEGSSLTLAEQGMGLRRRAGKLVLKAALADLARHYRIG